MSRIDLKPKADTKIAPREFVTLVTVGLEQKGLHGNWLHVGEDAHWYYKVEVNDAVWQEETRATRDEALSIIDTYASTKENLTVCVRDKINLWLDPEEAVTELRKREELV